MSINLKIAVILSICMRQKNADKVPRTGKNTLTGPGNLQYILVGGLLAFLRQLASKRA